MRYLNLLFGLVLLLFAGAQYNDPDGLFWGGVYLVPAIFAGLAAFRVRLLCSGPPLVLLLAAAAGWLAAVVWFWPQAPDFWRQEVWWESEAAREGMGVMVAAVVLIVAVATVLMARSRGRQSLSDSE